MILKTEQETQQLGQSLAALLRPGDVLLLRGELGAGKSVLARGIARGLGVEGPVSSPTFTIMNAYEGRLALRHFDLYRLADAEEFYAVGLEEYIGGEAVALVEWPERAEEAMPPRHLDIRLSYGEREGERVAEITPVGGFREMAL